MKTVLPGIRILVVIQFINNVCCQNGYNDQDLLRYQQQMASNDGTGVETITSYNTNIIQRDPNSQSLSSVNMQYHSTEESENGDDFNRSDRGRRKVIRIKNPFQHQLEENERAQNVNSDPQDSATGASNQYSAMQYSLPPEEFLQRMRAESQFYQQQQQQQQPVTQAASLSYTATPQPQYQYSTILSSEYNANQPMSQISEQDNKLPHQYQDNQNYQYNVQSSYNLNGIQSTTPAPYLSTPIPNNNYVITPSNSYVSSASSLLMSNPSNLQQYVSSPISTLQNASPDYGRSMSSTLSNNPISYESDSIKKMQIDHYDNSVNGVRYPDSIQQQLGNNYPTSTPIPSSSPFAESWQNNGMNSMPKSMQEISLQHQNNNAFGNQQDSRLDQNIESDIHRTGNMPAANNVFLNYAPPDYQALSQYKGRTRDTEHETAQSEVYSNGDYGWKLNGKRSSTADTYNSPSQQRYQGINFPSDGSAISQMSFHMDTGKPNKYEQISKSASDNLEAQEFAKAAAKAHQIQQAQQVYAANYNNAFPYGSSIDKYYGSFDRQRSKLFSDSPNSYFGNSQPELITASPYVFGNNNYETKSKNPFDHAKAIKGIVPIDVSNVVNQESHTQALMDSNTNKFNQYKEQVEQSLKQFYKPLTDAYYKDKNTIYGFNIQTKPDQVGDTSKQTDVNIPYYNKQQNQESLYNHNSYSDNKHYIESSSPSYLSKYISDSAQSNQQSSQRPTQASDIANFLKLNDIPYRLTQGLSQDSLKLHNDNYDQNGLPTPLPLKINQNVGSHQIDVASNILSKLMANNKQPLSNANRPEIDLQSNGPITNINGFKVANPFNVDLKLVADMLKGKPTMDDSQLLSLRDQYNKPFPLKLDFSQLQQMLLKNDNNFNVAALNDGLGVVSSSFFDVLNSGRYPYQGSKYSRSQEEEETLIPIADASNNHPIGAVMEQDPVSEREVSTDTELTAQEDDTVTHNFDKSRSKNTLVSGHRPVGDRHRHPNSLPSGRRRPYQRKYRKTNINEPYPLLKPPPAHGYRPRSSRLKPESRRRVKKPNMMHALKTEPLFETDVEEQEPSVSRLLMPPPPSSDAKSDIVSEDKDS